MEETTYVSDTLPACLPAQYLGIRVTVPHVDLRLRILETVFIDIEYICYKHTGMKTKKEHVHIIVIDLEKENVIRKRFGKIGYKGNQDYSVKKYHNGILCGIQYASKEGTKPICNGDFERFINIAPKWVDQPALSKFFDSSSKPEKGRDWQLTYSNLVFQVVSHVKRNSLDFVLLKDALRHMMERTKWRPSPQMLQKGVCDFYQKDYEFRLQKRSGLDMSWFENGHGHVP